jgi:HSP20 family molecular chaperone IbpA
MLNKKITTSLVVSALLSSSLLAFGNFFVDLDAEVQNNSQLIKEYKSRITQLEKRNKFLLEEKAKNPKLYEKKPLYEETKTAYINRIKLNGAEANKISFTIKNHTLSLEMNIKNESKSKDGYYASSRYFFQSYSIPKDVDESKIEHKVDGDYFVVVMPKKNK